MNARTPQEVLDELGGRLDAAYRAAGPGRRSRSGGARLRAWRLAAAIGVAVAVGVSTAAATTSIFATAPPLPRLSSRAAILATGGDRGRAWELLVTGCRDGGRTTSLLLESTAGVAGSACGPLVQPPGTLYDPASGRGLAFGAVPAATAEVELALGGRRQIVTPIPADGRALAAAGLPTAKVFVSAIGPGEVVSSTTAFDAAGQVLLACRAQRCATP